MAKAKVKKQDKDALIADLQTQIGFLKEARFNSTFSYFQGLKKQHDKIIELQNRIKVYEADEAGLRETIGHLNKALEALNGVTP